MSALRRVLLAVLLLAALLPATAQASDATLRAAVVKGNITLSADISRMNVAGDAYADKESAANRLRLTNSVVKVKQTTKAMIAAIATKQPSTAKGREAKALLLSGYRLYVLSIDELLATIKADARNDQAAAKAHYQRQADYARRAYPKISRGAKLLGLA